MNQHTIAAGMNIINGNLYAKLRDANNCGPAAVAHAMAANRDESQSERQIYDLIYSIIGSELLQRGEQMTMDHLQIIHEMFQVNIYITAHLTVNELLRSNIGASYAQMFADHGKYRMLSFNAGYSANIIIHWVPGHWQTYTTPFFRSAPADKVLGRDSNNALVSWALMQHINKADLETLTEIFIKHEMFHILTDDGILGVSEASRKVVFKKITGVEL